MKPIIMAAQLSTYAQPPVIETKPLRQPHRASPRLNIASPVLLSVSHAFASKEAIAPPAAARVVLTAAF